MKQARSHTNKSSKMNNADSSLVLQELAKKKKRGKDMDEADLDRLKKSKADNSETDPEDPVTSVLPSFVKFPTADDDFYPAEFEKTVYDCYNLKVVFDREKTGFEETKDFPIIINSIIAGRYQVVEYLGSAAFSKAIQCYDIHTE